MTSDQVDRLINAIERLAHGGTSGPDGLEAVAMAMNGNGGAGTNSVADGLQAIASSINRLADVLEDNLVFTGREAGRAA